jgi:UDP-N-acetylmuramate dehydrogenase
MISVKKYLSKKSIKYKENYNFGIKHGYKVNGIVSYYIEINNKDKLCDFLYFAKNNKIKVIGISCGTNVLINNYVDAVFLNYNSKKITINNNKNLDDIKILKVDGGTSKKELINYCIDNSLSNLEFWAGIPGSIAGGIAMNAGAYSKDISNYVLDIEFLSPDGIKKYTSKELNWSYRSLDLPVYHIISSASFITKKISDSSLIKNKCSEYINDRIKKHPVYFSSCGSVFKNPKNNFAWNLIKQACLDLTNINGAKLSLLHSNFIVNNGSKKTCSSDIIDLIKKIKKQVYKKFKIELEEEIKILT